MDVFYKEHILTRTNTKNIRSMHKRGIPITLAK